MFAELDDIYDIWPTSFWQTTLGSVLIALLAILAVICLVLLAIKFFLAKQALPWVRAQKRLAKLSKKLATQEDIKTIYSDLTPSIKEYVQGLWSIRTIGMTDQEVLEQLKVCNCDKNSISIIQNIVEHAQEIKFGYAVPNKQKAQEDIAQALLFVKLTAPQTKIK